MKLAIASGKGGTGKTSVAIALAQADTTPVCLLDCDVEEPNSHLFLDTTPAEYQNIDVTVPHINTERCQQCGACGEFCQFNALACLPTETMVFANLCHSCGGCMMICPHQAIDRSQQKIGHIATSQHDHIRLVSGVLDVSQAASPPLIRAVKHHQGDEPLTILDCPPGTSCPLITTVLDCDYVLLVTEPTPFGLHDLKIAVATIRQLNIAMGVIINRCNMGDQRVVDYCKNEQLPVWLQF